MANWLQKTFDSGVRRGLQTAEDRVKKEASPDPKNIYNKVRKEFNRQPDNSSMFGENTKFPKGMVPIGDKGFYGSPADGSFDPKDCSNPRNSTSPWCGYNPVTTKPIDLGVEVNINSCGGFVKVRGSLGFIDLPPAYAGYLKPECREDYKKENNKELPEPKTVPPGLQVIPPPEIFPPTPADDAPKLAAKCWYIVALGKISVSNTVRTETQRGNGYLPVSSEQLNSIFPVNNSWQYSFRESSETYYAGAGNSRSLGSSTEIGEPVTTNNIVNWKGYTITGDSKDRRVVQAANDYYYSPAYESGTRYQSEDYAGWQAADLPLEAKYEFFGDVSPTWAATQAPTREYVIPNTGTNIESCWMRERYNLYPAIINKQYDINNSLVGGTPSPNLFAGTGENILRYFAESQWSNTNHRLANQPKTSYFILEIYDFPCPESPSWNLPPFKDNCMPCCCNDTKPTPQQQRQDDEILRLLREIRKFIGDFPQRIEVYDNDPDVIDRQKENVTLSSIAKAIEHFQKQVNFLAQGIGIPDFPVMYPDSIVKPVAMNGVEMIWDWVTPDKTRKIQSIPQLVDWFTEQFSATMGQWHQFIEYTDDKGKTQKVSYPDLGTLGRELIKQGVSTIQAVGILTDIALKALQEATNGSLMSAEALKRVTDIQDYLDYPTQQKAGAYPAGITPKKDVKNLNEYLQPSQLRYQWDDWTPGTSQSQQEQLNEILRILTTMRANQGGE
jgi:hypothetical protein